MEHPTFPSEETLTAFIRNELDSAEEHRVVAHLATCTACYDVWLTARRLHAPERATSSRQQLSFTISLIAIAISALVSFAWKRLGEPASAIEILFADARHLSFRTVPLRLSADFDYRPLQIVTRAAESDDPPEARQQLSVAIARIKRLNDTAPTVENVHALGVSYLLAGYSEHAVQTLERANATTPDAAILSDLAAAYYAAGVEQRKGADIARSVDLSDAALAISPRNLPAQFNRALALEALENRPSALSAWQRYLQLDPSSEWATEAREHVRRLSAPPPSSRWASLEPQLRRLSDADLVELGSIARQFPLRCRQAVENDLLPRWARSRARGDGGDAARALAGVQAIGAALESAFGDPTVADMARTISTAITARSAKRLDLLMHGHLAYAQGRQTMERDTDRANAFFREAWQHLSEARSPMAYAAGMYAILQEYERRDFGAALRVAAAIKSDRNLMRYAPLAGQVFWVEGMVLLASGRPHESLQRYADSVRAFERTGEIDRAAAAHGMIAENLQALGDDDEAWNHRLRAIRVVLQFGDDRRQQVVFNEAAEASMQQGLLSAALEYQTASVTVAAGTSDDYMAAYSYLGRALILTGKGLAGQARGDIERARAHTAHIQDRSIRNTTAADVDMAEALLRRSESPAAAVPLFTRVLDYQRSGRYEFRAAQLLLARGRAHLQLGDDAAARADFSSAIAAVEAQRETVPDLRLRSAFFGRAEEAYDELIALLVRADEFSEAQRVFDRSCERTLTEVVGDGGRHPVLSAITGTPADGTAVVEIAVLRDEIVAWTIRRSATTVSRHPVASKRVKELVASYERALVSSSEAVEKIGSDLYDLLIRPLELNAASDKTVVFITDEVLRGVPMASLYDRFRKRYVVENFAVAIAPSAEVYWLCKKRVTRTRFRPGIVAVGNARTAALELGLPDLPHAERELRDVASQWRGQLLLNDQATPGAFLAAAGGTSIIHFAGHAIVNAQDRGRSALVLAPEGPDSSSALLYASRIADARLSAPLVVLSACTTNATPARAEGAVDVARAFLAAGVPAVVSSRWNISDDDARDFLTSFTRELARSQSPAEALRQTQLDILRRGDSARRAVRSWCAFDLIGAD